MPALFRGRPSEMPPGGQNTIWLLKFEFTLSTRL